MCFEKIKHKLNEEFNKNKSMIDEIENKLLYISANNFENRFTRTMVFSMVPWILSSLLPNPVIHPLLILVCR